MEASLVNPGEGPATEIADTDIIFECPQCAKSLAIDQRGGGLMILCPDCGTRIQVPVLDQDGLTDEPMIDFSSMDHEEQVRHLTEALTRSREKIRQLMSKLDDSSERRTQLERLRTHQLDFMRRMHSEMGVIQSAIDRVVQLIEDAKERVADTLAG